PPLEKLTRVRNLSVHMRYGSGRSHALSALMATILDTEKVMADVLQRVTALNRSLQERQQSNEELQRRIDALEKQVSLAFVANAIHSKARDAFFSVHSFQEEFFSNAPRSAYVVAIDLRRSTDLMLKARSADLFAKFITGLCDTLCETILESGGIFEKFTG